MKTKTSFSIVMCVYLLLIQGQNSGISQANDIADPSKRILFGDVANPADFPFLVRVYDSTEALGTPCGGSVISKHFVLTAAHCLSDKQCTNIGISPSTWKPDDEPKFLAYGCHIHESFMEGKFDYDIGIIETLDSLLEDGTMQAIPLPDPDADYFPGVSAVIAGWGKRENGFFPGQLVRADVVTHSWEDCNHDYQTAAGCAEDIQCPVPSIPQHAFCTKGEPPQPSGSCVGDAGGPAVIDGEIVAVMSGLIVADGACAVGSPSLLMKVVDFLPWIDSLIQVDEDTNEIPVDGESS